MKNKSVIVAGIAALMTAGFFLPAPAQELVSFERTFVLHPAPREYDSYSLYFDIIVKSPGLVRIRLDLENVAPAPNEEMQFVSVSLRQIENEVEVTRIESGPGGMDLEYGVDAYELDRTKGEYRIVISNWSRDHTAVARIVAWYPGEEDTGKREPHIPQAPRLEDLTF
jgi:hypothetical protein